MEDLLIQVILYKIHNDLIACKDDKYKKQLIEIQDLIETYKKQIPLEILKKTFNVLKMNREELLALGKMEQEK